MAKDYKEGRTTVFSTIGASSHSKDEREKHDYYATHPSAAKMLLELEDFDNILEPSCGEGHLAKEFIKAGKTVTCSDLIDRDYGQVKDFYSYTDWSGDIVTNPPYKYAKQFVEHSLEIIKPGRKVIMFLKITFLESKGRKELFIDNPPKTIYISSSRIPCAKNGDFDNKKNNSSAVAYAWYVWEKGYKQDPIIKWFN
jgi:hypothetical protein